MKLIEIENQYYISASSSLVDTKTMILKQGESFGIFNTSGDIHQLGSGTQGLYHEGTRYLSEMQLSVEDLRPLLLSSNIGENNEMVTVDLTNPDFPDKDEEVVLQGTIHVFRSKFIWEGVTYEQIRFINFGNKAVDFRIKMHFDADYCDIFEVRGMHRPKRGALLKPESADDQVILGYRGLDDIVRKTIIHFEPSPQHVLEKEIQTSITLTPKQEFSQYVKVSFEHKGRKPEVFSFKEAAKKRDIYIHKVKKFSAEIYTSNEQFNDWINRSKADLITMVTETPHGPYPYAGIPWYSTAFGRDGIITAFECLWLEPTLSKGVLQYLANTQATTEDDFTDAEPGKIFHETRGGEMAELGEIPFKLYYGTIDATPLFVCLAGAYYDRTADLDTIKSLWPHIEKAIEWINTYGDVDGDGFVEYATKSSKGLVNQGWKDSHDSIFYEDGTMAKGPIALCEVQAYAYDAKIQAAKLARMLDMNDKADQWAKEASDLKEKFNEYFWSEKKQTYYIALDGEKTPCDVITSNAGHCLFSGIATKERAQILARSLVNENMFSGWGVRTLASSENNYNPMSYHNGSVWPHDNAMIAYGLSRYGLQAEVRKILTGIFDLSLFVEDKRLPELFCGFNKRKGQGPTAYPVACAPQAWAVGTVFLLIQSILGLQIDAKKRLIRLYNPHLPAYLNEVTIRNLRIDEDCIVALQVRKGYEGVTAIILNGDSEVTVEIHQESLITA